VHLWFYICIRRYLHRGKTHALNLFSVLKGYLIIIAPLYGVPMVLSATYAMLGASGGSISEAFVENNAALVKWIVSLDIPGERPALDLSKAKNIVNVYYLSLAYFSGTFCLLLSLPLVPVKVRAWLQIFRGNRPESFGPIRHGYMFVVTILCCLWFLSFYQSKYTYGYELLPSGQFPSDWNRRNWFHQVQAWSLMGSTFSFCVATVIATLNKFFYNKG